MLNAACKFCKWQIPIFFNTRFIQNGFKILDSLIRMLGLALINVNIFVQKSYSGGGSVFLVIFEDGVQGTYDGCQGFFRDMGVNFRGKA